MSSVIDAYGLTITVGARTTDGGIVTHISDVDLNSAGTGTIQYVTVEYGDAETATIERYPATPRYTLPSGVALCDEITLA